ncbi:uncharacterized protein LOC112043706 [Bicyclus anynana]|uniref:Uncharacterized protein LOC112043706 n=1 Tax=Bicyclus anynana TaxID=110368 RepID=A0A6J1MWV1_BICAN|nr:uncharacterized protein LOC112043706 [Bicyclus anynana]
MRQTSNEKSKKKNSKSDDDDNVRYKINTKIFNSITKPLKPTRNSIKFINDDDNVRYKLPNLPTEKPKPVERKPKPKPKIKVNFWSNRQTNKTTRPEVGKDISRRHTIGIDKIVVKPKTSAVKVRKRVSFLPSPLFSDNHIPMVTVPDDLTIQLNEEEANDLAEDLNLGNEQLAEKSKENSVITGRQTSQTSPKASQRGAKRKHNSQDSDRSQGNNDNELEFFSKYVVQKLRRMETNQRIYSENLINTVLMLGQLAKLNQKCKISEA